MCAVPCVTFSFHKDFFTLPVIVPSFFPDACIYTRYCHKLIRSSLKYSMGNIMRMACLPVCGVVHIYLNLSVNQSSFFAFSCVLHTASFDGSLPKPIKPGKKDRWRRERVTTSLLRVLSRRGCHSANGSWGHKGQTKGKIPTLMRQAANGCVPYTAICNL